MGEKNTAQLAAALRLIYLWKHGNLGKVKFGGVQPTIAELSRTLDDNPEIRLSVNTMAGHLNQVKKIANITYSTLLHYAASREGKQAEVEVFLDRLSSGLGLTQADPVFHLRKFLLSQRGPTPGRRRAAREYVLALMIKAWNSAKTGKPMQSLMFRTDEKFPTL